MEEPVQLVQNGIGQQRRCHPTLRNPFRRRMDNPVNLHPRLQKAVNEFDELVVHHLLPHAREDRPMRDFVKAGFDIAFDDPGKTAQSRVAALGYGVVRTPIGPKPIGVCMELDLENGLHGHPYRLLDDLVPQAGDSKLAHFAVSLGNLHPPERQRLIRPSFQLQA